MLISQLKDATRITENLQTKRGRRTMESICGRPSYNENDLVISSFGKHPLELKRPSEQNARTSLTEKLVESSGHTVQHEPASAEPYYRRYIPTTS
jgi:hypothetical protein